MTKIVKSILTIAAVVALGVGITNAFFQDEETSSGNTFTAGSLDLVIDNECSWSGGETCPWHQDGSLLANWEESDLENGVHRFFNFLDIKPGDYGEDTISLHVIDNDAWGRLTIDELVDDDNGCVDSEVEPDPDCTAAGDSGADGELRENLNFWVWLDDGTSDGFQCDGVAGCGTDPEEGDNTLQPGEPVLIQPGTIDELGEIWEFAPGLIGSADGLTSDGHMVASTTYYFGIGWCFGEPDPAADSCDGSGIGDEVQTDTFGGDMTFEVEQYRNNPSPFPTP